MKKASSVQRARFTGRAGGATLEFAVVAPLLFLVFLGIVEFGRAIMVQHALEEAARAGCRVAILDSATQQRVADIAAESLSAAGISDYTLTTDPEDLSTACKWSPVTVTIAAPYSSVSWIPVPQFLQGVTLTGACTMPRETGDDCPDTQSDDDSDKDKDKDKDDDKDKDKDKDDDKDKDKDKDKD